MTNPRAIGARSTLFHWDSLNEAQSSESTAALFGYSPFISCQPLLFDHLPEQYGRQAFNHLMDTRSTRLHTITTLLSSAGVQINASRSCWLDIERWIVKMIEPSAKTQSALDGSWSEHALTALKGELFVPPIWHSLIIDLGLLLTHHLQQHCDHLGWVFWADSGVSDAQRFGRSP